MFLVKLKDISWAHWTTITATTYLYFWTQTQIPIWIWISVPKIDTVVTGDASPDRDLDLSLWNVNM